MCISYRRIRRVVVRGPRPPSLKGNLPFAGVFKRVHPLHVGLVVGVSAADAVDLGVVGVVQLVAGAAPVEVAGAVLLDLGGVGVAVAGLGEPLGFGGLFVDGPLVGSGHS